jgi:hypothetical protein
MTEPGVAAFFLSLARNALDTLRRNKLATTLSVIALIATSTAAFNSRYDERDRYRRVILPDIRQAEARFFGTMEDAAMTENETWRLHYFLAAHSRAREVLAVAKSRWPRTPDGLRAHQELVRYYELITEELAIIRTEMSINEELDYLSEWKEEESRLRRIRGEWALWANPASATPSVSLRR